MRRELVLSAAIALSIANGPSDAAAVARVSLAAAQLSTAATPRPTPTAATTFEPRPATLIGTIHALGPGASLILSTADAGDVVVDLSAVRDIWRETPVPPTALALGDDLTLFGERGVGVFRARYVYANIGRLDGVVLSIEPETMVVSPVVRGVVTQPSMQVAISKFLRGDSLTTAEIRPGDTIGAIVYYERDQQGQIAFRRITKMWR